MTDSLAVIADEMRLYVEHGGAYQVRRWADRIAALSAPAGCVVVTEEMIDCALRLLPNLPRVCMQVALEDAFAAAPAGCVVVPVEPTEKMLDAAMQREDDEPPSDWGKIRNAPHEAIYAAMLAAAPAASGAVYVNAVDDDGQLLYVHTTGAPIKRGDVLYSTPPAAVSDSVAEEVERAIGRMELRGDHRPPSFHADLDTIRSALEAVEQHAETLAGQINRALAVLGPSVPASVTDEGARWEWAAALDALTGQATPP